MLTQNMINVFNPFILNPSTSVHFSHNVTSSSEAIMKNASKLKNILFCVTTLPVLVNCRTFAKHGLYVYKVMTQTLSHKSLIAPIQKTLSSTWKIFVICLPDALKEHLQRDCLGAEKGTPGENNIHFQAEGAGTRNHRTLRRTRTGSRVKPHL